MCKIFCNGGIILNYFEYDTFTINQHQKVRNEDIQIFKFMFIYLSNLILFPKYYQKAKRCVRNLRKTVFLTIIIFALQINI